MLIYNKKLHPGDGTNITSHNIHGFCVSTHTQKSSPKLPAIVLLL